MQLSVQWIFFFIFGLLFSHQDSGHIIVLCVSLVLMSKIHSLYKKVSPGLPETWLATWKNPQQRSVYQLRAFKSVEVSLELLLSELEPGFVDILCRWPLGEQNYYTQKWCRKVTEKQGDFIRPWVIVIEWNSTEWECGEKQTAMITGQRKCRFHRMITRSPANHANN